MSRMHGSSDYGDARFTPLKSSIASAKLVDLPPGEVALGKGMGYYLLL